MKFKFNVFNHKYFILLFFVMIIFFVFLFIQIRGQNYKKELDCFKYSKDIMSDGMFKYNHKMNKCFISDYSRDDGFYAIYSVYENQLYALYDNNSSKGWVFNGEILIDDLKDLEDYKKLIKKYFDLYIPF